MTPAAEFGVDCTTCGHIELAADQIWLVLTDPPARNRYAFSCPGCSAIEHRLADDDTVALLSRFVPVERLDIPAGALEPRIGQTLTIDDLIDLMLSIVEFETPADEPLARPLGCLAMSTNVDAPTGR
jgi:hypothetical protein